MSASLILTALFSTAACEDAETDDYAAAFKHKIEELGSRAFTFPDSIDHKLIIASFYEFHPQKGNSVLLYCDSTKKAVKRIIYLEDSTSQVELLEIKKDNEFKSKYFQAEYIVRDKEVGYIYQSGNLSMSANYPRMDR
jgi:hypothetical protein